MDTWVVLCRVGTCSTTESLSKSQLEVQLKDYAVFLQFTSPQVSPQEGRSHPDGAKIVPKDGTHDHECYIITLLVCLTYAFKAFAKNLHITYLAWFQCPHTLTQLKKNMNLCKSHCRFAFLRSQEKKVLMPPLFLYVFFGGEVFVCVSHIFQRDICLSLVIIFFHWKLYVEYLYELIVLNWGLPKVLRALILAAVQLSCVPCTFAVDYEML